jgi:aryl-alcohol dehydrogenase-like predicted oxidoreductase
MKIALGTVQFGLEYGLPPNDYQVNINEVQKILDFSLDNNIKFIDTAFTYGDAEKKIGEFKKNNELSIMTKSPVFKNEIIKKNDKNILFDAFESSLKRLKLDACHSLSIHHCDDLLKENGSYLYEALQYLKQEKKIKKIGVSVYNKNQIDKVMQLYDFDIIQLPLNLYDQRLIKNGTLKLIKAKNIEIHARSVFLQGLLLTSGKQWSSFFNDLKLHHQNTTKYFSNKNITMLEACISFIYNIKEVDKIILGVNSLNHLKEILKVTKSRLLDIDFDNKSVEQEKFINPQFWPQIK